VNRCAADSSFSSRKGEFLFFLSRFLSQNDNKHETAAAAAPRSNNPAAPSQTSPFPRYDCQEVLMLKSAKEKREELGRWGWPATVPAAGAELQPIPHSAARSRGRSRRQERCHDW